MPNFLMDLKRGIDKTKKDLDAMKVGGPTIPKQAPISAQKQKLIDQVKARGGVKPIEVAQPQVARAPPSLEMQMLRAYLNEKEKGTIYERKRPPVLIGDTPIIPERTLPVQVGDKPIVRGYQNPTGVNTYPKQDKIIRPTPTMLSEKEQFMRNKNPEIPDNLKPKFVINSLDKQNNDPMKGNLLDTFKGATDIKPMPSTTFSGQISKNPVSEN